MAPDPDTKNGSEIFSSHGIGALLFAALLVLVFFTGCSEPVSSGDTAAGDGTIGTTTYKPRPMNALFPDFDAEIPGTAIGSETSAASSTETASDETGGFNVTELWSNVFLGGGIHDAREQWDALQSFSTAVTAVLAEEGVGEFGASAQTVSLEEEASLVDTSARWQIEYLIDASDSEYARYYFRNADTGSYQGVYAVTADADGDPVRGIFAYVNPAHLRENADAGNRVVAIAFDFTDSAKKRIVTHSDRRAASDAYLASLVLQQCDAMTFECLGEYQEIVGAPPARNFNGQFGTRFSWNESTDAVCLAQASHSDDVTVLGEAYSFTGPETPEVGEPVAGICELASPDWGDRAISSDDFLQRYEDTDPQGGTGKSLYVDGISTSGWDAVTPSLIESWLAGDFGI